MEGCDQQMLSTQGYLRSLFELTILLQHLLTEDFWVMIRLRKGINDGYSSTPSYSYELFNPPG